MACGQTIQPRPRDTLAAYREQNGQHIARGSARYANRRRSARDVSIRLNGHPGGASFTVGGVFMKLSEGLTKFWPTVIVFALFLVGAALESLAMNCEDPAVTYLWVVGLESILAFAFGVLLFSESCTPVRIAGVLLIASGIISLRVAS